MLAALLWMTRESYSALPCAGDMRGENDRHNLAGVEQDAVSCAVQNVDSRTCVFLAGCCIVSRVAAMSIVGQSLQKA